MLGAFGSWMLLTYLGVPFWAGLIISPLIVACFGMIIERLLLRRLYHLDHLYGLLLTYGVAMVIEGLFRRYFGVSGAPFPSPISGGMDLGFMYLPYYRAFVVAVSISICLAVWFVIEKTRLGSYLRAAIERPELVQTFGINVPRMISLTYGFGVGLAALAGVLAAPIYQVSPIMGSHLINVVFAVVVIGGLGSIVGAVVSGFGLGIVEAFTKIYYPEASSTVVFLIMTIVLMVRPRGLFGAR
jgi:branched-chain amino acid transport system permease protein